MKPSRGARSWAVFLIVVLTAGTGLVLWKLPGVITRIGAVTAAFGLGSSIVGYLRSWYRARPVPTAEQAGNAREALAGLVAAQWRREATVRRLSEPDPMLVSWRITRPEALRKRQLLPLAGTRGGSPASITGAAGLARWFRGLPRPRLVIQGSPGSGKTTLAVQLLLDWIDHRKEGDPVPVLFTLGGWDPDTIDFPSWLARCIAEEYPALRADEYGHAAAESLVNERHILPVLDGLDEIPAELRAKTIAALNNRMSYDDQLVITTRSAEYAGADPGICAATVIEPAPLTPAAITGYITACLTRPPDPAWRAVLKTIRENAGCPLSQALATPLSLWLFRQVYIGTGANPAPLTDPERFPSAAAVTSHLLSSLVGALTAANATASGRPSDAHPFRPRRRWNPDDAHRWLGYLARHAQALGTRDLAWWRLPATVPGWQIKLASAAMIGPLLAPLYGPGARAMFGYAIGVSARAGTRFPPTGDIPSQLLVGLIGGLAYALLVSRPGAPAPGWRTSGPSVRALAGSLRRGLGTGVFIGAVAWAETWIATGVGSAGFTIGTASGIAAGLGTGLLPGPGMMPSYANFSLRGRARPLLLNMLRGLTFGVAAGLLLWAFGILIAESMRLHGLVRGEAIWYARTIGLIVGLTLGLVSGLVNWAATPAGSARAATPGSTLRDERNLVVLRGLATGLAPFLVVGAISAADAGRTGLAFQLGVCLPFGAVCGLAAGLAALLSGSWAAYTVTRTVLASRRQLPLRLNGFLDDAYRLGILRRSGAVYQFRHATLHDHLAAVSCPER